MKKRFITIALSLALAIGLIAGGCTAEEKTENLAAEETGKETEKETEKEKVELHLADMSVYGIAIFNYANEIGLLDGYFDDLDYDVEVELSEWPSGVEQNSAFAAGEIDFSSMGNIPTVSGVAGGYGTKILAVNYLYDNEYVLVARADSGIKSTADLKGKNIGTYVGTVTHYAVAKYLESAGLTLDDINLLNVGSEAVTSLRNGDVDAVPLGRIVAQQLVNEGSAYILDDNQTPIYNYVVGREEFTKEYPEITVKVLELINDTWDYANSHQDEYIQFYADASGQELATVQESWADNFPQRYATDFSEEDKEAFYEFVDWMKSVEYVGEDVDADSLLDLSYVKELDE